MIDQSMADRSTKQLYSATHVQCGTHDASRLHGQITIASKDSDVWRLQSNTFQEFNDCSVSVSVDLRRLFSSFDHGV